MGSRALVITTRLQGEGVFHPDDLDGLAPEHRQMTAIREGTVRFGAVS